MSPSELAARLPSAEVGASMYELMADLFPLCRSITGAGLRDTLDRIGKILPLQLSEVPTGTQAFDWTVPKEWNIRDAWVANARGEKVIDFRTSNLHVVNYSPPVRRRLSLDELRPHLHTLPDHPTWVPYRTSYYAETGGSASAKMHSTASLTASTRQSSMPRWRTAVSPTASACCPAPQPRRSSSRVTSVTPPSPTTTSPAWSSPPTWPACWPRPNGGTRTGSSSRPAPSARSSGSAATRTCSTGFEPGWCWRVSVMTDLSSTSAAGGATPKWIEQPLMSFVAAGCAMRSSTSPRTATTSASSAHPASTCQ